MFKSALAAVAAAPLFAGAALAGPYVNVEANAGWSGDDYTGATTDLHVGYEGSTGALGYYVQGGPAFVNVDGQEGDTQFSGKVGASVAATEDVSLYGELAFISSDDEIFENVGGKLGVKYNF